MWVIGFGLLTVASAFALVWLEVIPPPQARILIRIRNRALDARRGTVRSHARKCEILRYGDVARGFIAVTGDSKVYFSRNIAPALRQRIRNVILNQ